MPPIYFIADNTVELSHVFNGCAQDPVAHAIDWWERWGLGCVVRDHGGRISCSRCDNGPGGQSGIWVTVWPAHLQPTSIGIHLTKQHWQQVRRQVWVGWPIDHPPTSSDLRNGSRFDGDPVRLNDGDSWNVPTIREPMQGGELQLAGDQHSTCLPTVMKRDLDGQLVFPIVKEYLALWIESGEWFDTWVQWVSGDRSAFNAEAALDFCLQVLQLRYRLPAVLADAMNLLDSRSYQAVIAQAIGWPAVEDYLRSRSDESDQSKKNGPARPASGNSGLEAFDHTTDPAVASYGSPIDTATNSTRPDDRMSLSESEVD